MKQIRKLVFLIILGFFPLTFLFPLFVHGIGTTYAIAQNVGLNNVNRDTVQVIHYVETGTKYFFTNSDSCVFYMFKALDLARDINYDEGVGIALYRLAESYRLIGDFVNALHFGFKALEHYRLMQDIDGELAVISSIGGLYLDLADYRKALDYLKQIEKKYNHDQSLKLNLANIRFVWTTIGACYQGLGLLDSAYMYQKKVLEDPHVDLDQSPVKALTLRRMADISVLQGDNAEALSLYREALETAASKGLTNYLDMGNVLIGKATIYKSLGQQDSAIYFAKMAYIKAQEISRRTSVLTSSKLLSSVFREKNLIDSALYYQDIVVALSDSLYGLSKHRELQLMVLHQQEENQNKINLETAQKERRRIQLLLSVLLVFMIISFLLYRNYRSERLSQQKIARSYQKLQSTQAQLIQSEKMASLGQLTAGIAHEIQNPLNFVNNFSEVSAELVEEMKAELAVGNGHLAVEIAEDIKQNLEKINHHGKRADAIVKGMLEHSRNNSGGKVPTDINALAEEYLRLSYHGMRAKDKSFNADFIIDFDPNLPHVKVVPQDIGRVLLNIINNAFQAVGTGHALSQQPLVTVSTKNLIDKIEISIADNGTGIPDAIKDKIFQPFFTTKPSGQGTGLGLSLSYDIVKAHGGEIKIESEEGKGSTFTIILRINFSS